MKIINLGIRNCNQPVPGLVLAGLPEIIVDRKNLWNAEWYLMRLRTGYVWHKPMLRTIIKSKLLAWQAARRVVDMRVDHINQEGI